MSEATLWRLLCENSWGRTEARTLQHPLLPHARRGLGGEGLQPLSRLEARSEDACRVTLFARVNGGARSPRPRLGSLKHKQQVLRDADVALNLQFACVVGVQRVALACDNR